MAPYQRQPAASFDAARLRELRAGDSWIWSAKTTVDLQKYAGALGLSDRDYTRRYKLRDDIGLLNVHPTPSFPAYAGVQKQHSHPHSTSSYPRASSTSDPPRSRRESYVAPKPVRPPIAYPPTPASQHASPMMTSGSYAGVPPKASPYNAFQPHPPPPGQVKRERPIPGDLSTYPRKLYECLEQSARIPPAHATNGQLVYHAYCRAESAYAVESNECLSGVFKDRHMANLRAAEAYIGDGYYEAMRGAEVEYVVLPDGTLKISGHAEGSIAGETEIYVRTSILGRGEFGGTGWA